MFLAPLLAAGCGSSAALWVRIEAPLLVPDDADEAAVQVVRSGAVDPIFDTTYPLAGKRFPLTLSLTSDDPKNTDVLVSVTVRKAGQLATPWSQQTVPATLTTGEVREVLVRLCDCPH
jgi:hypothetical protein